MVKNQYLDHADDDCHCLSKLFVCFFCSGNLVVDHHDDLDDEHHYDDDDDDDEEDDDDCSGNLVVG